MVIFALIPYIQWLCILLVWSWIINSLFLYFIHYPIAIDFFKSIGAK